MPVLVRGKLHTVVLPESFQEETAEYIDIAIGKILRILNCASHRKISPN